MCLGPTVCWSGNEESENKRVTVLILMKLLPAAVQFRSAHRKKNKQEKEREIRRRWLSEEEL